MKMNENKVLEVFTPSHKDWPVFRKKLNETVAIYYDGKLHSQCQDDLTLTSKILESLSDIDIKETLIFFKQYGGSCDCKVLVNVARIWNNR